jgi:hypothetical protein
VRDDRLGRLRQVDRDAVAAPDAAGAERVGEAIAVAAERAIGDDGPRALVLPDQGRAVGLDGRAGIDAGHRDVEGGGTAQRKLRIASS